MSTSLFLANAWGAFLVIISLAFLINSKALSHLFRYMKDEGNIFVTGYLTLVIGILSVVAHNVWVGGWPVIITVLGWLTLVKGVIRITFPYFVARMVGYFEKNADWLKFFLVISLALGIYLLLIVS